MKVYTRKGDKGFTSDLTGRRIEKFSLKIELQGSIDELNSYIGICRSYKMPIEIDDFLKDTQYKLYLLGVCISKGSDIEFMPYYVDELEQLIDKLEEEMPKQNSFIYYSGCISSTSIQYTRSLVRRVERKFFRFINTEYFSMDTALAYINRLSDCLYVIGRYLNHINGVSDERMVLR